MNINHEKVRRIDWKLVAFNWKLIAMLSIIMNLLMGFILFSALRGNIGLQDRQARILSDQK